MKIKGFVKRYLEGMVMGLANIIPGVSGGTMALILGIYERLINSINSLPLTSPILLMKGEKEEFKQKLKKIDYRFLIPLVLGIASATLLLARFIQFFLDKHPGKTFAFFFGLIFASAGTLYHKVQNIDYRIVVSGAVGFLFAFLAGGLSPLEANHSPLVIFFSGAIAIVSLILPGISGSFVLVYLRQYEYLINALNSFDLPVLLVFMVGAVIGLFSFAKFLEYLLENHKRTTLVFLFGLILGALRVPVDEGLSADPTLVGWVIPAAVGAILVSCLDSYYRSKKEG
ncbi:MAG: DUF368 domain-containing protein [Candidatus Thermoplasmatota archaeon]|nr:DUF368 domain-containing protein [Candidatus Thermoplasmatota archaeon]